MSFRPRLLPIVIFAAFLLLSVRIGGLWESFDVAVGTASVAQKKPTGTEANAMASGEGKKAEKKSTVKSSKESGAKKSSTASESEHARAGGQPDIPLDPDELSEAELKVLQELVERRVTLQQRERDLDIRAGLLKAAEKRVEEKIAQLKAIQESISAAIEKRDEKAEAQLRSLVKIYEKMKPKDAARIFGQLDLEILLKVIGRMKETKIAPILAAMDPAKAREVTVELAGMRKFSETAKK